MGGIKQGFRSQARCTPAYSLNAPNGAAWRCTRGYLLGAPMELLGTSLVPIRFTLLTELRHSKVDEGDEVDEGGASVDEGGTSVDEGECVKKGCEDFVV